MKPITTLQQAILHFADPDNCHAFMVARRWPDGVVKCPTCGSEAVSFIKSRRMWECKTKHPRQQFSVKVGTVMEDSPLPLSVWLPAMWMIANDRNGISSWEIHRALGITQKSAWFLLHRIRLGMQDTEHGGGKLGGRVEVDETFIGGKARNMHRSRVKALGIAPGGGYEGKTIVLGMLERGGRVRTSVVPNREANTLQSIVPENVKRGAKVITDEHSGYNGLEDNFLRGVINHAVAYVDGQIHTNGMENYWSLVKRGINGTYVSVEPFHLFRYLDEQSFRYNNRKNGQRKLSDADRFGVLAGQFVGKRLTYSELTGKEGKKEEADF